MIDILLITIGVFVAALVVQYIHNTIDDVETFKRHTEVPICRLHNWCLGYDDKLICGDCGYVAGSNNE